MNSIKTKFGSQQSKTPNSERKTSETHDTIPKTQNPQQETYDPRGPIFQKNDKNYSLLIFLQISCF